MPNKQRHRGQHPNDVLLFGEKYQPILKQGVSDLSYLLSRNYAEKSAVKLVGDRYQLKTRQRMAVMRMSCSDQSLQIRKAKHILPTDLKGKKVAIDGYNLLITIESALSNGILLEGRDGCYKDLASVHGSYKRVEETLPALQMIGETLKALEVEHAQWHLDQPVSNSGRLKGIMYEIAEAHQFNWDIALDFNPDKVLATIDAVVITSDGWILDEAAAWTNLTKYMIDCVAPSSLIVSLLCRCLYFLRIRGNNLTISDKGATQSAKQHNQRSDTINPHFIFLYNVN